MIATGDRVTTVSSTATEPARLSSKGRRIRLMATALVGIALLLGAAFGNDDNFPFGPFRMYSTTNDLDGTVNAVRFYAVDSEGRELTPRSQDFGLRPAEVNGQVARFRADPDLLGRLAEAYVKAHPDAAPLRELTLGYGIWTLEGGRPVAYREEKLVTWRTEA
ncbi:MAG: hypothetical protein QOG54_1822 [Actinomycetota bacterium]|jgi:hypothetical protein|nr:hypothetical protein [Actinomycetota bacterium]